MERVHTPTEESKQEATGFKVPSPCQVIKAGLSKDDDGATTKIGELTPDVGHAGMLTRSQALLLSKEVENNTQNFPTQKK